MADWVSRVILSRLWPGWRNALVIAGKPEPKRENSCIPNWSWHHHADMMAGEEALLFPVNDGPMPVPFDPNVEETGTGSRLWCCIVMKQGAAMMTEPMVLEIFTDYV